MSAGSVIHGAVAGGDRISTAHTATMAARAFTEDRAFMDAAGVIVAAGIIAAGEVAKEGESPPSS